MCCRTTSISSAGSALSHAWAFLPSACISTTSVAMATASGPTSSSTSQPSATRSSPATTVSWSPRAWVTVTALLSFVTDQISLPLELFVYQKLFVILENENFIRSSLEDLRGQAGGTAVWLVGSPHFLPRMSPRLTQSFDRVIEQADFAAEALIELLTRELREDKPGEIRFLTDDESCELACCALAEHFGQRQGTREQLLPFVNKMASKAALVDAGVRLPHHRLWDKRRFASERRKYCEETAEAIGFPMIVKPVDRAASMDVS